MKTILIILTLTLGLNLSAQRLNDQGLYVNNDGDLFTGMITSNRNDIKSEFLVSKGKVTGEATYFYASGNIMEKGMFTDGKKDQKWIRYNESGTINAIAFYSLGKKSGTWIVYDDKGNKRFEMNYSDGEKSGLWTSWDENGVVLNTKDYSLRN